MAEYIERERLRESLKSHYHPTDQEYESDRKWAVGYNAGLDRALHSLHYAPAADVAPVVHGEWITLDECANEGVYCSVCHKKVYKADYAWCVKKNKVRSNYCPNCGANMKDGEG